VKVGRSLVIRSAVAVGPLVIKPTTVDPEESVAVVVRISTAVVDSRVALSGGVVVDLVTVSTTVEPFESVTVVVKISTVVEGKTASDCVVLVVDAVPCCVFDTTVGLGARPKEGSGRRDPHCQGIH